MFQCAYVVRDSTTSREGRAVVKLPRVRARKRERDTLCSVVHNIVSRDVISEMHTRKSQSFLCDTYCMLEKNLIQVFFNDDDSQCSRITFGGSEPGGGIDIRDAPSCDVPLLGPIRILCRFCGTHTHRLVPVKEIKSVQKFTFKISRLHRSTFIVQNLEQFKRSKLSQFNSIQKTSKFK